MEVLMNTKITGWVLTVAPIATLAMWFLTPLGTETDRMANLMAAAADPDGMKIFGLLSLVFSIAYVSAFLHWANDLKAGALGVLAVVGSLHLVVGLSGALAEIALFGAGAKAASAGAAGMATGMTYWAGGIAFGSAGIGLMMLGVAVIGVAAYLQKATNPIVAIALTVSGLLGVYGAAYAYEEAFMTIPYIAVTLSHVALGVTLLRK